MTMNDQPNAQPAKPLKSAMLIVAAVVLMAVTVIALTTNTDSAVPQQTGDAQSVQWITDLKQATNESASSGRPMFALFTQDGCPPCEMMQRDVYPDPRIGALLAERFVAAKLDMTRPTPELIEASHAFDVVYVPTLIVLDAAGQPVARHTGGLTVEQLEQMLHTALSRIESASHNTPAS
jgi:thiol:disulfide interchange protein DsbD